MIFDLLCSEYGWTTDYVLDHVTPAQVELLMDAVAARRRAALAQQMGVIRMAVWGEEHQVQELHRALAVAEEHQDDAQALAAMGVTVTRRKQGGLGNDDGQPAG